MPMLTRLALRDYPRRYHQHVVALGLRSIGDGNGMNQPWHSALPTDRGLLSILTRMELPLLTSLEIAYMAEARRHSSEHALLSHIVDAFPRLQHLEIHRYRTQRRELTRFTPIAKILSRARSLRTVRLGLDCYNDPGAYCRLSGHRGRWLETLRTKVGPKILAIMQARCPSLEHVAILYHGSPSSVWIEFHPPRCGAEEEPRVVVSYDEQYVFQPRILFDGPIPQSVVVERPPIPQALLPAMRSLTIASPNPGDDFFPIDVKLTQLSLCDCPRFYNFFAYGGERIGLQWGRNVPILNPTDCLSILERMSWIQLASLELVYMVTELKWCCDSGADLLTYIGKALPALSHLELHRYRFDRTEQVGRVHIARTLTAVTSLRPLCLNLDFHDDHQAYCDNLEKREPWHDWHDALIE
uniref:Aminotransferase class I/II-fold pyridoxal phosphate-dependent enzyme (Putative acyl-CoA transferase WcbT) n=1 Tax=Ganoderma boninense TaxID=34458 RepID=A0A5K1JZH8_9APHY|nr:Aminotransferase class I/II-fold pyridoxal phosphate-dependent enzyme (Putative acyl-CoA transferase WcbT) [Ganoderma boninense]